MARKKNQSRTMALIWEDDTLVLPQCDLFLGSEPYSGSYAASGIVTESGIHSTGTGGEFPNEGEGYSDSSLSQVLETEEDWLRRNPGRSREDWFAYLSKYYLSARACAGILRRAEKRGRELPPMLEAALRERAGDAEPGDMDEYIREEEL